MYLSLQTCITEENVQSNNNRLDIESILTIPAVELSDTGNITCTGTNEAGANSSTTYLLVIGQLPDSLTRNEVLT